ncbi:MAG: roadblock/LC7 domain-containing protein [Methanomicrobiaceae archaeon]|nr:roadblock/LC7 domain-containing protein [Methanomicrobiaceae archaeon]
MPKHGPLKEKIQGLIDAVMALDGVVGCALISREGRMLGSTLGENVPGSVLAAMSATVAASTDAAASILHMKNPSLVLCESEDGTLSISSAGETALITAIIDRSADVNALKVQLANIGRRVGEEL